MYTSEICAEGIFVTFPWWLKNVKSRSKITLFFKWTPFWNLISKKRTITFFWSKLSKLHKKDPILHVATTFSIKQGETRTSHGPIPQPLTNQKKSICGVWLKTATTNFNVQHISFSGNSKYAKVKILLWHQTWHVPLRQKFVSLRTCSRVF